MYSRLHRGRRALRVTPKRRRRALLLIGACVVVCFVFLILPGSGPSDPKESSSVAPTNTPAPTEPPARPTPTPTALPLPSPTTTRPTAPTPVVTASTSSPTATSISAAPTPVQLDSQQLQQRYGAEVAQVDALDVMPTRPGERRIGFVEFAGCISRLLAVNPATGVEAARDDLTAPTYAPFLISVTLEETQDLKALLCNLTVPYRYLFLAQNGDTPEVTPFFQLLRRVFAFTTRLTVQQFPEGIGFAGAVNAGLREALRHPFREVPFIHILHNDVRYLSTSLSTAVRSAYTKTSADEQKAAALEREVAMEPNEYTPLVRQPDGLRAPLRADGPLPQQRSASEKPVLVTSALLPDRVRTMSQARRREEMLGHVSLFFSNRRGDYTSVFVSRLAVLTVGFFDENFYPILYDDTDYRWRAHLLGFTEDLPIELTGQVISFDIDCVSKALNAGQGGDDEEERFDEEGQPVGLGRGRKGAAAAGPSLSPQGRALQRQCRKSFYAGVQFSYMAMKWGVRDMTELMSPSTEREPFASEAFAGKRRLPLDAWVLDTARLTRVRAWLRDVGQLTMDMQEYDANVILRAVSK